MRFNRERALAFISYFDTARLPGSVAEREAAKVVANEFTKARLGVRKGEISTFLPYELTPAETWSTALLAVGAGVILQWTTRFGAGRSTPWILAAIFLGLAVTGVALRLVVLGWSGGRPLRSTYVAAESSPEQCKAGSSRVVFLTRLDSCPPASAYRFRRDVELLDWVWLGSLWIPCLVVGGWGWLTTAGPALLISLGLITLIRRTDRWTSHPSPHTSDNRTGLALLMELARTWPRTPQSDLAVAFVATGVPSSTWLEELRREIVQPEPEVPTLVINLHSPGVGDTISLSGDGIALEFAETAARDLWLPAQVRNWSEIPLDHRALRGTGLVAVSLVGDLDASQVEPRTLAATAQLVTELALRWAARTSSEVVEETPAG